MTRARDRHSAILDALFWGPVLVAAIWIVVWPPLTVDGPAHLLGARAIADHSSALYGSYYEIDWFPTPNLAGTGLLALLVSIGGLRFAGTVMLLLAALGTPLALRYAVRAVRPESSWLAIVGLPLAFGYLYFYGFWNYCLAIALALTCVGLALRAAPEWRTRPTLLMTVLLTLTWLTHLVPFAAAALFLTAVVVRGPRQSRAWLGPIVAVVPAAVLSLAYLVHTDSGAGPTWTNPVGRAIGLVSLHTTITTYSRAEDAVAAVIAVVLAVLWVLAGKRVPASGAGGAGRAAGLATVGAAVLVLVTPTNFGIDFGLIDERLAIFPVLFGVLWLAARPPEPRVALAAATALVVATGALAVVRAPKLHHYDELSDEYLSAGKSIDEDSVILALRFASYGPDAGRNSAWDPTRHLASEVAAERFAIDVGHYEAVLDYFPARFREPNPREIVDPGFGGLETVPPTVRQIADCPSPTPDPNEFSVGPTARRLGRIADPSHIDYVLLIGVPQADERSRAVADCVKAAIAAEYELVGETGPRGLVQIWKLRG